MMYCNGLCSNLLSFLLVLVSHLNATLAFLTYPRGGSIGYLAAVAMPLDLPQRDVYVAFNLEANYGLPPNSTYLQWVNRWNLAQENFGIGNNITGIDGRAQSHLKPQPQSLPKQQRQLRYTRDAFYRSFIGYANAFGLNGNACLLRTICEVAESNLDEHNGLLGSIFKILFMPTTSARETYTLDLDTKGLHEAEHRGRMQNCTNFLQQCPHGVLNMISYWY